MRLIDADKCPCILCEDTRNAHCTYEHRSCEKFCNWLNNTAYSVEKIVEELEIKSDDIPMQYEDNYEKGFDDGICYAIDIVRGGVK